MSPKLVVYALLAGLLAGEICSAAPGSTCICPRLPIATEFRKHDVVFVGTVVSGDAERFVLKVDRLWKGDLPPLATMINVHKRAPKGDPYIEGCDYQIGTKAPSVIFAMRAANGDLSTGPCTGNGPASDTATIDFLNTLAKPRRPSAGK